MSKFTRTRLCLSLEAEIQWFRAEALSPQQVQKDWCRPRVRSTFYATSVGGGGGVSHPTHFLTNVLFQRPGRSQVQYIHAFGATVSPHPYLVK